MSKHKPVVLFFLANGGVPTADELEFIKKGRAEGVVVAPRNRLHVNEDHKPEPHDAVHAFEPEHIPAIYSKSKGIEEALREYLEERAKRRALIGDEPAPPTPETKPGNEPKKPDTGAWKKGN